MTPVKTAEEVHDQSVHHGYGAAFVFITEINFKLTLDVHYTVTNGHFGG